MELKELLKQVQPDRPRQRVTMPINEWLSEYAENGYISIPIYMSVKAKENPDGYKWSAVRKIFSGGHINLHEEVNKVMKKLFAEAFFTVTKDKETDHRFVIVVPAKEVSAMRKNGYYMKSIVEGLSDAVTTPVKLVDEVPGTSEKDKTVEKPSIKVETPKSENTPKSKKNKKK